jgi:DNA-damage-inducible protein J
VITVLSGSVHLVIVVGGWVGWIRGLVGSVVLVAQLSYITIMATNAFVRARIDGALKDRAAAVLEDMGLTVSDLVRIVLTKVAKEKALPFEMRVPNKLTRETLAKSDRGEDLHHAKNADDLFRKLGI